MPQINKGFRARSIIGGFKEGPKGPCPEDAESRPFCLAYAEHYKFVQ